MGFHPSKALGTFWVEPSSKTLWGETMKEQLEQPIFWFLEQELEYYGKKVSVVWSDALTPYGYNMYIGLEEQPYMFIASDNPYDGGVLVVPMDRLLPFTEDIPPMPIVIGEPLRLPLVAYLSDPYMAGYTLCEDGWFTPEQFAEISGCDDFIRGYEEWLSRFDDDYCGCCP